MRTASFRRIRFAFPLAALLLAFIPQEAYARDICVAVDEPRDMLSARDRTAAVLLLSREFELAGEHIVPAPCAALYTVVHVQIGTLIMVTLSGESGQRDATASSLNDLPAVYKQMVRALLKGVPMNAPGVVDRGNVSETQARARRRVSSDSLFYARLGYGAMFGDQVYGGPSVGLIGYRREFDAFGLDVSFLNFQYKSSKRSYGYGSGSNEFTGSWLKLSFMRFTAPRADRSPYVGGGLSWSGVGLQNDSRSWSGSGLQGELMAGYEFGRASSVRVFVQADAGLPFYNVSSDGFTYIAGPPYVVATPSASRYVPSLAVSLGVGWQRGGRE